MPRLLAAVAAVLLASALWSSFGTFQPVPLALVTLALAAAIASLLARDGAGTPRLQAGTAAVLAAGAAAGLASQLLVLEGDRRAPAHHPYFVSLAWVAAATLLTYALPRPPSWVRRGRFPLLVLLGAGMIAVSYRTDPLPVVDVWMFRQGGATTLLRGGNPYELTFPNLYRHERFYGPGALQDGKVTVYPYPPLQVLVDVPFFAALGDVRWASLAALVASALLVARLGARPASELAALLVLFQPRTLYVLEVSWTEPVVLAAWSLALWTLRRWRARAPRGALLAGIGSGLLLAAKQYSPVLALPLALAIPRRPGWGRGVLAAAAALVATFLPFALWNARELWHDVAVAQFLQPFRRDALSWLAAWARWRGGAPSAAIGFGAAAVALAVGARGASGLRRSALTGAAAFLALVVFNKQAFCNYYWLAAGLFASAAVLDDEPAPPLRAEGAE